MGGGIRHNSIEPFAKTAPMLSAERNSSPCAPTGAFGILDGRTTGENEMSKQKLTPDQREAVRKQAKERVASGTPRAEIVKSIAEKYRISTVSARNYLPDVGPAKKTARRSVEKKNGKPGGTRKVRGRGRKLRIGSQQRTSRSATALLNVVANLTEG